MEYRPVDSDSSLLRLHEVFQVLGDQLTARDVRVLKFMYSGSFTPEFLSQVDDGCSFLLALEKIDRIDESNFKHVEHYLKVINRHDLIQYLALRRRKTVCMDPVDDYLEKNGKGKVVVPTICSHGNNSNPSNAQKTNVGEDTHSSLGSPPVTPPGGGTCTDHGIRETGPLLSTESPPNTSCSTNETEPNKTRQCDTKQEISTGESVKEDEPDKSDCSRTSTISDVSSSGASSASKSNDSSEAKRGVKRSRTCSGHMPRRRSERLKRRSLFTPDTGEGTGLIAGTPVLGAGPTGSHGDQTSGSEAEVKKKVTCDIRLRVRAEYCDHQSALQGNIHSNKPELAERQFEKFMQANTILKSRDLGSIICDIKFSELTYLDAFWRDYINGSLLEALKGVFITESLKQAVGHEAIRLLVNVDEDDYQKGRLTLLKALLS